MIKKGLWAILIVFVLGIILIGHTGHSQDLPKSQEMLPINTLPEKPDDTFEVKKVISNRKTLDQVEQIQLIQQCVQDVAQIVMMENQQKALSMEALQIVTPLAAALFEFRSREFKAVKRVLTEVKNDESGAN